MSTRSLRPGGQAQDDDPDNFWEYSGEDPSDSDPEYENLGTLPDPEQGECITKNDLRYFLEEKGLP